MIENRNNSVWFFEDLYKDHGFSFEVSEVLVPEHDTGFQKLAVYNTPRFGKVLVLDGIVQLTEIDECAYHETMAHTALFSHPSPKKVLIIGGGDCGIAREVLKHQSVESVRIVDIDPEVTEVAKEFFPTLTDGVIDNPRLTILNDDATNIDLLFPHEKFDVILLDTTDETNVASPLFQGDFSKKVHSLLSEQGIMIRLGGSLFFQKEEIKSLIEDTKSTFGDSSLSLLQFSAAATYYGGPFCLILAWKDNEPNINDIKERIETSEINTKWYSFDTHNLSFVIPKIFKGTYEI